MSDDGYVVALIGAASEIGREVQAVLRERGFPVAEWRLYAESEAEADDAWEDSELADVLLEAELIDLEGADVVFLCGSPTSSATWAPRAAAAGAVVIDPTHALAEAPDATLVVPEVNADLIAEAPALLVCPVPGASALAVVLHPLHAAAELKRIVVTAFEPVSVAGRSGVEELAQQTRELLSGSDVEPSVFSRRIAFNLIPQVGDFVFGDRTRGEWLIESQTRRLLDLADLPIAVTSVCVPTFYGQAYAVCVETERPLDAAAARALLRGAPSVLLFEEEGAYPTLADTVGSEATHVGRVRDDPTVPYGLALWIVIDGLRKGAAGNAVQLAERAVRERG